MIELSPLNSTLEQPRLQALRNYDLREAPHDSALDDIARLAAHVCNAPVGAVTVVERDEVLLVGRYGIEQTSAPRRTLPCETTINGDGLYQIPDARRDPEYAPNGIPVGDKRYRFYAGAPVLTPDVSHHRLRRGARHLGTQADSTAARGAGVAVESRHHAAGARAARSRERTVVARTPARRVGADR